MKRNHVLIFIFASLITFQKCNEDEHAPLTQKSLAVQWADLTLQTIRESHPNSPTYTSRSLGYIGLTMYESVVHGSNQHQSLSSQLNGLSALPQPETGLVYNWELSLNAAQSYILKHLYSHASHSTLTNIGNFEIVVYDELLGTTSPEIAERSVEYGRAVAVAIYNWSMTDGGHEGYLRQFDSNYNFPTGPGKWLPPLVGQSASPFPLHPYWGDNRTFTVANATLPVPAIVPYSTIPGSSYYKLFHEVYIKRHILTNEEKRIAAWWADDPSQTASPPGHSYNLASIAILSAKADLFTAAEVYAKVGMAVADAFICCWKAKYTYHSERPFPFISTYIDNSYVQFWPEPPFPAFTSGHATQSAAAATALISVFGNYFLLVDNTYENRDPDFEEIKYVPRKFITVWSTATECAYSRFLGGIHTRQDNETGLDQGKKIGENVVNLVWKK